MVYATETEFVTTSMLSRIVTNCSFPFLVAISHIVGLHKPDFRSTPKVLSHYGSLASLPTHTMMHVDMHHRVHLQDRVGGEERHRLRVRSHVEQPRDLRSSHNPTPTWFMKHAMISLMLAIISFTESDTTSHPHTVDTPSVKSGTRFIILCSSHPQPTLTANTSFTLRSTAW